MLTKLVTVQAIVQYFDKNSSFLVSTYAQMVFLKKLRMAKCSPNPKRPQIGIQTHLNMLYFNPAGFFQILRFFYCS